MEPINTEKFSEHLRQKAINVEAKSILITNFSGSQQEKDLTEPANCNGFGRVRHFKYFVDDSWVPNPLPILPAINALGLTNSQEIRAQVFQNSICNWRCWYCFVDFKLLNGDSRFSSFLTCNELLDLYIKEENPPMMIDLTGGQPDLTPEWIPWMMEVLVDRGLDKKIFLWSDDNLSNDYLWRFLTHQQLELLTSYKMYSRVCCFKGIDERSFSINTRASPVLFSNQFDLCQRLLELNLDLYFYITLTANTDTKFQMVIPTLLDRLQKINPLLPLRTVPLKIFEFSPVISRMDEQFKDMLEGQVEALRIWKQELETRFSSELLKKDITQIKLKN